MKRDGRLWKPGKKKPKRKAREFGMCLHCGSYWMDRFWRCANCGKGLIRVREVLPRATAKKGKK